VSARPRLDFGLMWFAQRRLAYAIESHCSCDAHGAGGTGLGGQSSDYIRESHSGICFWGYGSIGVDIDARPWNSSCHTLHACIQTSFLNWPWHPFCAFLLAVRPAFRRRDCQSGRHLRRRSLGLRLAVASELHCASPSWFPAIEVVRSVVVEQVAAAEIRRR
jgi:hypothetical protein